MPYIDGCTVISFIAIPCTVNKGCIRSKRCVCKNRSLSRLLKRNTQKFYLCNFPLKPKMTFSSSNSAVYFYTRIKIYSFYTSFIRVCLPKLGTRLYLYKHLYKYKLEKKSHFFACDIRALGNQPMLVQTRQRVKYLCLFVLLVHASNSVRNRAKLHRCALLSPHESPWAKLWNAPLLIVEYGIEGHW